MMDTAWHEREAAEGEAMLDQWLRRELRARYRDVLDEPVPDELVALILG